MGASVPGRASAERPARVTRPGSARRMVAPREVVVAMVIAIGDSPTKGVVPCASVVVGVVGAFCGEPTFEGFSHRFGQERPGDGGDFRSETHPASGPWRYK